jgi:hypothetical protein
VLILPLIDLLILTGTGMLVVGFLLKVAAIATVYRPSLLGFSSMDFVVLAGICWGFALTLAARSWVRLNEPRLMAVRREQMLARARQQAQDADYEFELEANGEAPPRVERAMAGGERR